MINSLFLLLCFFSSSAYAGPSEVALIKAITEDTRFQSDDERMRKIEKYLFQGKTGMLGTFSQTRPANLNYKDPKSGKTILRIAIENDLVSKSPAAKEQNRKIVHLLLKVLEQSNDQYNEQYGNGSPEFDDVSLTVSDGDDSLADILVESRAKRGLRLNSENLKMAIDGGNARLVNYICNKGVETSRFHITRAVRAGNVAIVKILFDHNKEKLELAYFKRLIGYAKTEEMKEVLKLRGALVIGKMGNLENEKRRLSMIAEDCESAADANLNEEIKSASDGKNLFGFFGEAKTSAPTSE